MAQPAGCSHDVHFWLSSRPNGNLMEADSIGVCSSSAYRTLRVEIKYDGWPTDSVVSSNSNSRTGTDYYTYTATCDGGQTKPYYGRAFLYPEPYVQGQRCPPSQDLRVTPAEGWRRAPCMSYVAAV